MTEEAALNRVSWRKSSHSGSSGGECVEVGRVYGANAVRDSKDPDGGVLALDRDLWAALMVQITRGEFDLR
ncbi:DUF397 domain-containing protein [Actinomadura sp. 7K507]|uniref:DUF397 domain-containing protein n=1 Tax=Actinomadura sp. 7K507 TaxID=2530365 RepID=UPI001FB791B6|nr:DUF397 domain-containing protein [Actinomadura sp. 7K507]